MIGLRKMNFYVRVELRNELLEQGGLKIYWKLKKKKT